MQPVKPAVRVELRSAAVSAIEAKASGNVKIAKKVWPRSHERIAAIAIERDYQLTETEARSSVSNSTTVGAAISASLDVFSSL